MSDDLVKAEKQKYLRENVMERGFDIEKFVSYLQDLKENGENIDNWALDELKEVVEKYVQAQNVVDKPSNLEEQKADGAEAPVTSPTAVPSSKPGASSMSPSKPATPAIDSKLVMMRRHNILRECPSVIGTKELPANELTSKKISIKIVQPVIKEGGIFSSKTVSYVIETQPFGWQVIRSYTECMWLREQLQKHFPGYIIPPLNKKGAKNKTDTKSLGKRMKWLHQFFNEVRRDPTLRSSEVFYYFVSMAQRLQFDAKKKELNKVPAPKTIFDTKNLGGKAANEVSDRKIRLAKNIGSYIQNTQNLYTQLAVATDSTVKVIQLLSDCLARNADLYRQFSLNHANIECAEMTDLFNTLRNINISLSAVYTKQAAMVQEKFGSFFKYYKEELDSLKDLFVVQDKISSDYLKREEQLAMRKERLFDEGKVPSWELSAEDMKSLDMAKLRLDKPLALQYILPKETKKLQEVYYNFGYYTNKLLEGARNMMVRSYRSMRRHLKITADEHVAVMRDMYEKWQAISEHFKPKISKLGKKERSELLYRIKAELGVKDELIEVLA